MVWGQRLKIDGAVFAVDTGDVVGGGGPRLLFSLEDVTANGEEGMLRATQWFLENGQEWMKLSIALMQFRMGMKDSAVALDILESPLATEEEKDEARQFIRGGHEGIGSARVKEARRKPRPGVVYVLVAEDGSERCKIGMTRDVGKRVEEIGVLLPFKVRVHRTFECDDPYSVERHLHERFADRRISGEWFRFSGEELDLIEKALP